MVCCIGGTGPHTKLIWYLVGLFQEISKRRSLIQVILSQLVDGTDLFFQARRTTLLASVFTSA